MSANHIKAGDIVTRCGTDEQVVVSIDGHGDGDGIVVRCVKPPEMPDGEEPWCNVGDVESNAVGSYSLVRNSHGANRDAASG